MKQSIRNKKKYNNGIIAKYFVPGTQPEGWVLGSTEAKKKKNSESQKKLWENKEYREHQVSVRNTPEYTKKLSDRNKKYWEDNYDDMCVTLSNAATERFSKEEEKQKASQRMTKKWEEETYRENQTALLQESHKDLYVKHPEYLDKIRKSNLKTWEENKDNILAKQYKTKTENNSWNYSSTEDKYYNYLLQFYKADDIKRQYSDERYPFQCDFYIKSEDLFIEIQGTWTHGPHPFDENNEEGLKLLEQWKEKSKTSSYYKNAITVWTVSDPLKIKIAKENNLNIKFIY